MHTIPGVDGDRIAAFGLSSGGTAILEAAVVEPRLKALIALDATVRDSLPRGEAWFLKALLLAGKLKMRLTQKHYAPAAGQALAVAPKVASDPDINHRIVSNPLSLEAFMAFPLPGRGAGLFCGYALSGSGRITAPTLVLWGEDDQMDPPKTGQMLFEALTCKKRLQIIPGNGHVGHLDRNRARRYLS